MLIGSICFAEERNDIKDDYSRKPASANCFAKGDQDGYNQALLDYQELTGKPAGCTRLLSEPITMNCPNSVTTDYQAGFRGGYTGTMRNNVSAHKTNMCPSK